MILLWHRVKICVDALRHAVIANILLGKTFNKMKHINRDELLALMPSKGLTPYVSFVYTYSPMSKSVKDVAHLVATATGGHLV